MTIDDVRNTFTSTEIAGFTAYGEARGEPVEGQIAVLHTIRNRALIRRTTLAVIALERLQYSCWWETGDNQQELMKSVALFLTTPPLCPPLLQQCVALAGLVAKGLLLDNTTGATFYLTRSLYTINPPSWVSGHLPVRSYGQHLFFKNIAPYIVKPTPPTIPA